MELFQSCFECHFGGIDSNIIIITIMSPIVMIVTMNFSQEC